MNLRRILQGITLFALLTLGVNEAQAQQAQLAAANQDGLVQLGSNHPFVVSNYEIDLSTLSINTVQQGRDFFKKYIDEGFDISINVIEQKATLKINVYDMYDVQSVPVADFNQKLRDIHRIRR